MATLDDLTAKGYEVGVAFEGDGFTVYRVDGPGISTQVRGGDADAMQGLLDSYDEALRQQAETPEETMARLAGPPAEPAP